MSPSRVGSTEARGPMRIVVTTYPSHDAALRAARTVLRERLAACANLAEVDSHYWWKGRVESARETLVLFKTVPERVGALFRFLSDSHPYEVPEVVELDVPRAAEGYRRYLTDTLGRASARTALGLGVRRPAGRRVRGARSPGRTRVRHRLRSR